MIHRTVTPGGRGKTSFSAPDSDSEADSENFSATLQMLVRPTRKRPKPEPGVQMCVRVGAMHRAGGAGQPGTQPLALQVAVIMILKIVPAAMIFKLNLASTHVTHHTGMPPACHGDASTQWQSDLKSCTDSEAGAQPDAQPAASTTSSKEQE
eukprot:3624274-Rhodomonas_salina.1